jgi:hypothetical protein
MLFAWKPRPPSLSFPDEYLIGEEPQNFLGLAANLQEFSLLSI